MEDVQLSKIWTSKQGSSYSGARNFSHYGDSITFEAHSNKDRRVHGIKILSLETHSNNIANRNLKSTVFLQEMLYSSCLNTVNGRPIIQSLAMSSHSLAIATRVISKPVLKYSEENKFSSHEYVLKMLEDIVTDAIFLRKRMKIPFAIITLSTLCYLELGKRFCICNWANIVGKEGAFPFTNTDIGKLMASDMRELGIITLMMMGIPYENLKSLSIAKDFLDYSFALEDLFKQLQKINPSILAQTILRSMLQKDPLARMKPQQLLTLVESNRTDEEIRTGRHVMASK